MTVMFVLTGAFLLPFASWPDTAPTVMGIYATRAQCEHARIVALSTIPEARNITWHCAPE
jgi:hypothetical protein